MFNCPQVVAVISACLLVVGGCGESGGPSLTGSVTYNGAPVENGLITFEAVNGGTSFGAGVSDGKYIAKKVYTGQFKVTVQANPNIVVPKTREDFERQNRISPSQPESFDYIPEDAEGNGQTVEVKLGDQTLDFAITGPPLN